MRLAVRPVRCAPMSMPCWPRRTCSPTTARTRRNESR
jgi:hypothetical protein